jgi:leader peptidase (prepilin peptidase)/N-methyltransferase
MIISLLIVLSLGWVAGGLLNYLADRLPARSRRDQSQPVQVCHQPMPFIRYLTWPKIYQGGSQWICLRSWLVLVFMPLAAAWLWLETTHRLGFVLKLIILVYLGLVIVIDIEHHLILFPTIWVGALLGLAVGWSRLDVVNSWLGGLAAVLISLVIFIFGHFFISLLGRLRRQKIEKVAFGFGDVLLSGVIGLMVGWPLILRSLLVSILAAGLFSLVYLLILFALRRYSLGRVLPYAPLLIFGAIWVSYF